MTNLEHAGTCLSPTAEAPRGKTAAGLTADRLLLGEESERIVGASAWLLLVVQRSVIGHFDALASVRAQKRGYARHHWAEARWAATPPGPGLPRLSADVEFVDDFGDVAGFG